ncbi:hypothetical protein [Lactococcus fujiensis]|uniref:hypothetical protein n=1 Tax=Lactococcus fujiensis TaxID=610251 RepID=UPI0006CFB094|nr:hypothetical protein [Lactococcus fujiensis]
MQLRQLDFPQESQLLYFMFTVSPLDFDYTFFIVKLSNMFLVKKVTYMIIKMLLIRYKNRQEKLFKALEIENENNVVCWHPMRGIIDNNIVNDELKKYL